LFLLTKWWGGGSQNKNKKLIRWWRGWKTTKGLHSPKIPRGGGGILLNMGGSPGAICSHTTGGVLWGKKVTKEKGGKKKGGAENLKKSN